MTFRKSLSSAFSCTDIVFFGENLPARFFTSMKMVSGHQRLVNILAYFEEM